MKKVPPPSRAMPSVFVPDGHFLVNHNGALTADLIDRGMKPVEMPKPTNLGELAGWLDWMMPKRPYATIQFLVMMHNSDPETGVLVKEIETEIGANAVYLKKTAASYMEQHPMPVQLHQYGNKIIREDTSE